MLRSPPTTAGKPPAARAGAHSAAARDEIVTIETYRGAAGGGESVTWRRHPVGIHHITAAVFFFAAALACRAPFIVEGETLLHSDEAIVGLMAQDIAAGERFPIFFYGQRYMGALEAYAVALFSTVIDNPVHALRFGPAFFFAVMAAMQYLMLTRWFGPGGGFVGAAATICAAPMIVQWTVSARGGYVEVLLWGTMLLWAYSEWFVDPAPAGRAGLRKALFGAIIGSGMWINPAIVVFLAPVILHALLNRPLAAVWNSAALGPRLRTASDALGYATLPVAALCAVLLLNVTWSVWVEDHKVRSELLLGLVPRPVAAALIAVAALVAAVVLQRWTGVFSQARARLARQAALILGLCIGALPVIAYVILKTLRGAAMDPSLPLGLRPLWRAGETMNYLWSGLPLLFSPDPRGFVRLVSVGRDTVARPVEFLASQMTHYDVLLAIAAIAACALVFLVTYRRQLFTLLSLRPCNHGPAMLLFMGVAGAACLYVMGGCTLDFTTIRYLVPLWVFVPGMLAAVFVSRQYPRTAKLAPVALCGAWLVGQVTMFGQLGAPHPLRPVADDLIKRRINVAVAEPLDAHLLSYLTGQKCRTIEFESFWPRLTHYYPLWREDQPMDYLVQTNEVDRTWDWINGGWPGEPPPETHRFLWPRLRRVLLTRPELVESRTPLSNGYELIRLKRPLPDRSIERARRSGSARKAS